MAIDQSEQLASRQLQKVNITTFQLLFHVFHTSILMFIVHCIVHIYLLGIYSSQLVLLSSLDVQFTGILEGLQRCPLAALVAYSVALHSILL